jgi:hypothetical protein
MCQLTGEGGGGGEPKKDDSKKTGLVLSLQTTKFYQYLDAQTKKIIVFLFKCMEIKKWKL